MGGEESLRHRALSGRRHGGGHNCPECGDAGAGHPLGHGFPDCWEQHPDLAEELHSLFLWDEALRAGDMDVAARFGGDHEAFARRVSEVVAPMVWEIAAVCRGSDGVYRHQDFHQRPRAARC
jgi:DNA-binding transcriptional LysR family regulator